METDSLLKIKKKKLVKKIMKIARAYPHVAPRPNNLK